MPPKAALHLYKSGASSDGRLLSADLFQAAERHKEPAGLSGVPFKGAFLWQFGGFEDGRNLAEEPAPVSRSLSRCVICSSDDPAASALLHLRSHSAEKMCVWLLVEEDERKLQGPSGVCCTLAGCCLSASDAHNLNRFVVMQLQTLFSMKHDPFSLLSFTEISKGKAGATPGLLH